MRIHPERVRALREKRGYSQAQLAKRAGVSEKQISRIESRRSSEEGVRETTLERLAQALSVDAAVLTGEVAMDASDAQPDVERTRSQVGTTVPSQTRLFYDLVQIKYDISTTALIEMAPLLFVLLAEQSLRHRRRRLQEVYQARQNLEELAHNYLGFVQHEWISDESLEAEHLSIEDNDVFGVTLQDHSFNSNVNYDKYNQFNNYLAFLGREIGDEDVVALGPNDLHPGFVPDYSVCGGVLGELAGDSPVARQALLSGRVRIRALPNELWGKDALAERVAWLEGKIEHD